MSTAKKTRFRIAACAYCEWIMEGHFGYCSKCGWEAVLSAHSVYGDKAYEYQHTQEPWKRKKMWEYEAKLEAEIGDTRPKKETPESRLLDAIFGDKP